MTNHKYVILYSSDYGSHFTYDDKTDEVFCTHGGWGGKLVINEDDTCKVVVSRNHIVECQHYKFTDAESSNEAYDLGIIDLKA